MSSYLKLLHDFDQPGAVGRRQAAPLVEDGLQLSTGQLIKVQLHKAVPESPGQHLEISQERLLKRFLDCVGQVQVEYVY